MHQTGLKDHVSPGAVQTFFREQLSLTRLVIAHQKHTGGGDGAAMKDEDSETGASVIMDQGGYEEREPAEDRFRV